MYRQVRVAELEAGFSLACTLGVCVAQEWGRWDQVAAAIAIPVAMAFSVHGLNNAKGLARWNWLYLPARVAVIALGVAYSYQHYLHFLTELDVFGLDLRPWVAVIMELLTVSALIAHEAHTARLAQITRVAAGQAEPPAATAPVDNPGPAVEPAPKRPASAGMTLAARLRQPQLNGHPTTTGGTNP
ncbi:MAG: hypothetical protein AAGA65_27480 [Actinomycetota bacterium]